MAEDQSIKNQIAAMEGWATLVLKNKLNVPKPDYEGAKGLLKHIDRQGRKLEWRRNGIRKLPDIFTKDLKTQISSARASAQKIIDWLDKKDFEQKKELYLKLCKQYATSMTEMLRRATNTVEDEPWNLINFPKIRKEKWFASVFEQFAQRKGYYKDHNYIDPFSPIDLEGALLAKANLKGAKIPSNMIFSEANLEGVKFKGADLKNVNFEGANLVGANFEGANLSGARFETANLTGANFENAFLFDAHFNRADLQMVSFKGANIEHANFWGVRHLTKEQIHSAKNWEKADNLLSYLK